MEQIESEKRLVGWLPTISVGLAGLAVFVYLSVELDFAPSDLVRFFVVALVLIFPVGWLTVYPIPVPAEPRLARIGLAVLVGYPATVAIYFVLGLLHLESVYPVFILFALVLCIFLFVHQFGSWSDCVPAIGRSVLTGLRSLDVGAVVVFLLSLLIVLPWLRYLVPRDGNYADVTYHDAWTHVALTQEMFRGVPPRQFPSAAGEPFTRYHVFHHIFVMLAVRYGKLDILQVFFVFVPILLTGLIVLGLCLTLSSIFKSRAVGWIATGSVYVFGPVLEEVLTRLFHVGGPAIRFIYYNSAPALSGVAVVAGFFGCLALSHRLALEQPHTVRRAGLTYLASFLAAVLYMFKAPFFVLIFPSYFAGLALLWLRDRDAYLLRSMLWSLLTFGLLHFGWSASSAARLIVQYGAFAQTRLLGAGELLDTERYRYGLIERYLLQPGGRSAWLGLLILTVVVFWRFVHLSPILPAYFYNRARVFRRLGLWEVVLVIMFPVAFAGTLLIDTPTFSEPPIGNLATAQLNLISLVSLVLNASLIAWFSIRRAGTRLSHEHRAVATLALLVLVTPVAGWVTRQWAGDEKNFVPSGELAAFEYLAEETPREAVIVTTLPGEMVAALSGRRVVAGRYEVRFPGRRAAVRELYSTTDSASAQAILSQYHVDYLIEDEDSLLHFEKEGVLHLAFDGGTVKVYQVNRTNP